jgi:hypothetical protein
MTRSGEWIPSGWSVTTSLIDLEHGPESWWIKQFIAGAPFVSGIEAIVDGAVLVRVAR